MTHHIEAHSVQLGVDRARHRTARRLKRHLGDRLQPVAVGFDVKVTEPGYPVNGREMRYVDGVFANLLRMRPELPSRRLGCVER